MQVSPLSEKHRLELEQAAERALSQWLPEGRDAAPREVVRALDRVLLFLKQNGDASAQARHVASLAFCFGAQLVRAGHGSWHSVSEDGSVNPSVVTRGRACLVVDAVTTMVAKHSAIGLSELFYALAADDPRELPGVVVLTPGPTADAVQRFERDVAARLTHVRKVLRMWGSPEELEAVAQHFVHLMQSARQPSWSFDATHALWLQHGGPFAGDADEHAAMRTQLWAEQVDTARAQVVTGFVSVWAGLQREPEREQLCAGWIETLLDEPGRCGAPDRLNAVLFALMGFVATDAQAFVAQLTAEREHLGGHGLRPLHIVAPRGPNEAALSYTRRFTTWEAVSAGIGRVIEALRAS